MIEYMAVFRKGSSREAPLPEPSIKRRTELVDPELLEILVCPETKEPVRLADSTLLERVNRAIRAGTLKNRGGEDVHDVVEEGLVREDDQVLYPVRDDIPVMLINESIPLGELA